MGHASLEVEPCQNRSAAHGRLDRSIKDLETLERVFLALGLFEDRGRVGLSRASVRDKDQKDRQAEG